MKINTESTRRALRTALQALIALPTVIPLIYSGLTWLAQQFGADNRVVVLGFSVLAGLTLMTKVMATLEERGLIRPILRYLDPQDAGTVTRSGPPKP